MKKILVSCLLGALSLGALNAAPAFESGFYAGLGAGYTSAHGRRSDTIIDNDITPPDGIITQNEAMGANQHTLSIFAGYLHRFEGTDYTLAIEPTLTQGFGAETKTGIATLTLTSTDQFYECTWGRQLSLALPVHLGYVFKEQFLVYALVGPDLGLFQHKVKSDTISGFRPHSKKRVLAGVTYGAGVVYQFKHEPLRVGFELRNTTYARSTIKQTEASIGATSSLRQKTDMLAVSLKVMYCF